MIHDVTNMGNVKMEHVYVLLDGMEDIVLWKGVQIAAPIMDSADLILREAGSADVITAGMEKTAASFWNRAVEMEETMIKVSLTLHWNLWNVLCFIEPPVLHRKVRCFI